MVNDTESFASYFSDPYDECGYMELELKRSKHRKNNTVGDLPTRYRNHLKWSNSSTAKDVERAVNLVPETFGISVRDLKHALKASYNFTDDYAKQISP